MKKYIRLLAAVLLATFFVACKEGETTTPLSEKGQVYETSEIVDLYAKQDGEGSFSVVFDEAGKPVSIDGNLGTATIQNEDDALNYVLAYRDSLKIDSQIGIDLSNIADFDDSVVYKFSLTYEGIDIAEDAVILYVEKDGNKPVHFTVNSSFDPDDASLKIKKLNDKAYTKILEKYYGKSIEGFSFIDRIIVNGKLYDAVSVRENGIISAVLLIDAKEKEVVKELTDFLNYSYSEEKRKNISGKKEDGDYVNVSATIADDGVMLLLHDDIRNITMYWMNDQGIYDEVMLNPADSYSMEYSVSFETLKYVEQLYDFYKDWLNIDGYNDKGEELRIYTNARPKSANMENNASWNALLREMFIGPVTEPYRYTAAYDKATLAHEYAHAVLNEISGFNGWGAITTAASVAFSNGESYFNAIQEGYADAFAFLTSDKKDAWKIGVNRLAPNLHPSGGILDGYVTTGEEEIYARDIASITKNEYSRAVYGKDYAYLTDELKTMDGHDKAILLGHVVYEMYASGYFTKLDLLNILLASWKYGYTTKSTFSDVRNNILSVMKKCGYNQDAKDFVASRFDNVGIFDKSDKPVKNGKVPDMDRIQLTLSGFSSRMRDACSDIVLNLVPGYPVANYPDKECHQVIEYRNQYGEAFAMVKYKRDSGGSVEGQDVKELFDYKPFENDSSRNINDYTWDSETISGICVDTLKKPGEYVYIIPVVKYRLTTTFMVEYIMVTIECEKESEAKAFINAFLAEDIYVENTELTGMVTIKSISGEWCDLKESEQIIGHVEH